MFCIYGAWYGLGRSFTEGLRTDSLYIGGVRVSQALALVSALTAVLILIIMRIKAKKAGFVLYRDTEESKAAILAEEEAEKAEKERKKVKGNTAQRTPYGLFRLCLHIFRHLAQKLLDIRQYACVVSIQSAVVSPVTGEVSA